MKYGCLPSVKAWITVFSKSSLDFALKRKEMDNFINHWLINQNNECEEIGLTYLKIFVKLGRTIGAGGNLLPSKHPGKI